MANSKQNNPLVLSHNVCLLIYFSLCATIVEEDDLKVDNVAINRDQLSVYNSEDFIGNG